MAALRSLSFCLLAVGLLLPAAASTGQIIYITAEAGQDVTLPCRAGKEKNITVVEWIRPDLRPDYVLFYMDGHFDSDLQHPSFRNRVDLQDRQMKDGDASLILKDVKINDTGTYECKVIQGGGNRRKRAVTETISIIHLDVFPPATKRGAGCVEVEREEMAALRSLSFCLLAVGLLLPAAASTEQRIRAEAGQDSVTLPCATRKEKKIRVVRWSRDDLDPDAVLFYRDDHFYPDQQHPSFMNRVDLQDRQMKDGDGSLILKDVKINDTGTYQCTVIQGGGYLQLISIIHLVVSPPEQRITAEAGQDSVTLPCGAGKETEIRAVEWIRADLWPDAVLYYRDDHFHPDRQHPSFMNRVDLQDRQMKDGNASLILKDVKINDTGTYHCRVIQGGRNPWRYFFPTSIHLVVSPPAPPPDSSPHHLGLMLLLRLLVFCPYFISTLLLVSVYRLRAKGSKQPVSVATAPPLQAEPGLDGDYDDVTTEHQF
ncbi:junctional adhesion molecule-like [Menidia menidia]